MTCHGTFAPLNIPLSCFSAGPVTDELAKIKRKIYAELMQSHHFIPLAMETMGVFEEETLSFLIVQHLQIQRGDSHAFPKLCLWISVCIQRLNSVSILVTIILYDIVGLTQK
jgi:hypothetical protein